MPYHPGSQRIKTLAGLRYSAPSLIAQAIAVLAKYGGSLWLADPAHTFTGSDGNGVAGDGSDAGYVRDLCATYGPELVTNGDFSAGTAGWAVTGTGAVLSVASGVATVTNGGSAEASLTLPNTVAGKVYEVTADIVALSGTSTVYFVPPAGSSLSNIPKTGAGQLRGVFVSGGGGCRIAVGVSTAGAFFSIDNISVREVRVLGPELFPISWVSGAIGNTVSQSVPVTRTLNADDSVTFVANGTASATFIDPVNNLLPARIPTQGGEAFEVYAQGYSDTIIPAGAAPSLLVAEGDVNGSYIRGTMVPFGTTKTVVVGADCKNVRVAVFLGSWTIGAAVNARFTVGRPSIRQVFVSRPLFQATTGFKPKLRRVPKKLGPELVTNGDFANGSNGWSLTAAATVSGGSLSLNGSGSDALATQSSQCFSGASYQVSYQVTSFTSGNVSVNFGGQASTPVNAVGNYSQVLSPTTSNSTGVVVQARFGIGFVGTVDNISVREVLEWTWAWVFDGGDDWLGVTGAPASPATAHTMGAAAYASTVASRCSLLAMRNTGNNTPLDALEINTGQPTWRQRNDAATTAALSGDVFPASTRLVVSMRSDGVNAVLRQNGVQKSTSATTTGAITVNNLSMGIGRGANVVDPLNGGIFAAFYIPGVPTDAEMLIIERAMGQVGGITI